jgi:hypothetical protein
MKKLMSKFDTNPIAQAIQDSPLVQQIRNLLYEDMPKSEIREIIQSKLPNLTKQEFDLVFTEAFVTL